jgi:hypothetical protein
VDAEDIPFFAALVFPGFFAMQAFFWATHQTRMSDAMRIVWSFALSAPLFFGMHGFWRHLVQLAGCTLEFPKFVSISVGIPPLEICTLPPPETIAASAGSAPIWFLASLYVGGFIIGYLGGLVWRTGIFDRPLRLLGLDLRRHRGLLSQALNQQSYVDVLLQDTSVMRGWPALNSLEGDEGDAYLFLTKVGVDEGQGDWKELPDVLIPLDRIERIFFLDPEQPLMEEENSSVSTDPQTLVDRKVSAMDESHDVIAEWLTEEGAILSVASTGADNLGQEYDEATKTMTWSFDAGALDCETKGTLRFTLASSAKKPVEKVIIKVTATCSEGSNDKKCELVVKVEVIGNRRLNDSATLEWACGTDGEKTSKIFETRPPIAITAITERHPLNDEDIRASIDALAAGADEAFDRDDGPKATRLLNGMALLAFSAAKAADDMELATNLVAELHFVATENSLRDWHVEHHDGARCASMECIEDDPKSECWQYINNGRFSGCGSRLKRS